MFLDTYISMEEDIPQAPPPQYFPDTEDTDSEGKITEVRRKVLVNTYNYKSQLERSILNVTEIEKTDNNQTGQKCGLGAIWTKAYQKARNKRKKKKNLEKVVEKTVKELCDRLSKPGAFKYRWEESTQTKIKRFTDIKVQRAKKILVEAQKAIEAMRDIVDEESLKSDSHGGAGARWVKAFKKVMLKKPSQEMTEDTDTDTIIVKEGLGKKWVKAFKKYVASKKKPREVVIPKKDTTYTRLNEPGSFKYPWDYTTREKADRIGRQVWLKTEEKGKKIVTTTKKYYKILKRNDTLAKGLGEVWKEAYKNATMPRPKKPKKEKVMKQKRKKVGEEIIEIKDTLDRRLHVPGAFKYPWERDRTEGLRIKMRKIQGMIKREIKKKREKKKKEKMRQKKIEKKIKAENKTNKQTKEQIKTLKRRRKERRRLRKLKQRELLKKKIKKMLKEEMLRQKQEIKKASLTVKKKLINLPGQLKEKNKKLAKAVETLLAKAEKIRSKIAKMYSKENVSYDLKVCSRRLYVDEIDLDDTAYFEENNLMLGQGRIKRFREDHEIDRMIDFKAPYTGMFQDCKKRIDFVLAITDAEDTLWSDEFKLYLLTTLVKIGFDLEIERGTMPQHNNLLFVKIHAPDKILDDYKDHFEVTNYFQDNHVHFLGKSKYFLTDWLRPEHEREWVKLMRRRYIRPLRLSNRDRSYITYMIISHQPYGERDRHYGLWRLLRSKVVVDAYALHDGPYFITDDQATCNLNGRQILFYSWSGLSNMIQTQPLSVIYEYYGPKLAMYFAFYQFYLWMLLFCIPISPLLIYPSGGWHSIRDLFSKEPSNIYCKGDTMEVKHLCPTCMDFNACPPRNLTDYCMIHKLVRLIQKGMNMSPAFTLWCLMFLFFWRRKQNYWKWLWELGMKPVHPIVRVEYEVNYPKAERSRSTGAWHLPRLSTQTKLLIGKPFLFFVTIFIALGLTYEFMIKYKIQFQRNDSLLMRKYLTSTSIFYKYREYVSLGYCLTFQFVITCILEWYFHLISPTLTELENHRLFKYHEKSLAFRLFAYSMLFDTTSLIYTYWIKGRFFKHPLHHWNQYINITFPFDDFNISIPYVSTIYGNISFYQTYNYSVPIIGFMMYFHCNKTINCIDEMAFVFVGIIMLYTISIIIRALFRTFPYIYPFIYQTDYNQPKHITYNTPEWEREFTLKNLDENTFAKWTNQLMVQLALFMWFGNIAPWMSVPLLGVNLIIMRLTAGQLVSCYKRPILFNCRGLGAYNKIIFLICLVSPITHAINNARNDLFWKSAFNTKNYSMVNGSKEAYKLMPSKYRVNTCLYPTKFRYLIPNETLPISWPFRWLNITNNATQTVTSYNHYLVEMSKILDIIKYVHFFLPIVFLLFISIPSKRKFVLLRMNRELEIRRYAKHEEFIFKDDDVGDIVRGVNII